jgi:hypothetical protein
MRGLSGLSTHTGQKRLFREIQLRLAVFFNMHPFNLTSSVFYKGSSDIGHIVI